MSQATCVGGEHHKEAATPCPTAAPSLPLDALSPVCAVQEHEQCRAREQCTARFTLEVLSTEMSAGIAPAARMSIRLLVGDMMLLRA